MNFKSKKFQNIYIILLLVAIISIFTINVIQANSATNNSLVLKEKSPILDEEIEGYIPDEEVIVEDVPKIETINNSDYEDNDSQYNNYEESEDMYATIDLVYDKILAQIKKANELRIDKHQKGTKVPMEFFRYRTAGSGKERTIVSSDKRFEPKPLFDDEAALQLEQRADDEFLVFLNAETEHINIIYRRKNGQFGLIDVGS